MSSEVTFEGILTARRRLAPHLRPTPLLQHPLLSNLLAADAWVKHENLNPTGSFKIRGGINLVSSLSQSEREAGVITATRGNHGQSIALAGSLFGVRAVIAVPEGNNPEKNEAMEAYGGELLIYGRDFDEARERVEQLQHETGMRYIHSANEPLLIHGVGTYALEILEEVPDPDFVFVPIGGGSGASGLLTAVRVLSPSTKIIGVQASQAPAVYESWKRGSKIEKESADTIADGLATRVPFDLTFSIISREIDEILTVSEEELRWGVAQFFRTTHNVAEPAAASTLAAAYRERDKLRGKKVVLILSGCNITRELFAEILGASSK